MCCHRLLVGSLTLHLLHLPANVFKEQSVLSEGPQTITDLQPRRSAQRYVGASILRRTVNMGLFALSESLSESLDVAQTGGCFLLLLDPSSHRVEEPTGTSQLSLSSRRRFRVDGHRL